MTRLGLPVSHSGQKVIHLDENQKGEWRNALSREQHRPSIELGRAQDHDPIVPRGVICRELLQNVAGHRARAEDGKNFQ